MFMTGTRLDICGYLRRTLIGPKHGESEEIEGRVHLSYMMGILYAQQTRADDLGSDDFVSDDGRIAEGTNKTTILNSFFNS